MITNKKKLYDIVQTRKGNLALIIANKKDEIFFFKHLSSQSFPEEEKDAFRVHFFDANCTERKEWFHPDDLTIIGNIPEILAKLKHLEFEIKLLK